MGCMSLKVVPVSSGVKTRMATCDWSPCLDLSAILQAVPRTAAIYPSKDPNHVYTVCREPLSSRSHSEFSSTLILY